MSKYAYNVFTGALDIAGSESYIDAVVATPADLPVTIGTPALDSVYLAKAGSGVWLINRRPSGLYCRVANNGNLADWVALGAFPEVNSSANWSLYDGTDPTKELKFDLSGLATATVRTVSAPAGNGRMLVEGQSIGSTTPSSGAFTTLSANNGTITASAPVLDLSQTWNNAAVTFRGVNWSFIETAAGGSSEVFRISTGASGTGAIFAIRRDGNATFANGINVGTIGGSATIAGQGGQWRVSSGGAFGFCDVSNNAYGTMDTALFRDAADTLALRRTTNPQAFNIYNTFSSSTNHERGFMRWSSNVFQIGTEKGSVGGSVRNIEFIIDGTSVATIQQNGFIGNANAGISVRDTGSLNRLSFFSQGATRLLHNNSILLNESTGGYGWVSSGSPTSLGFDTGMFRDAAGVVAQRNGTNAQAFRLYNTVSGTNNVNFDRVNFRWASNEFIIDAEAGGTGTLRGIKIGSATSSLLGFYGATPVDRPATVADPAGGGTVDAEARTAINDIIDRLQELGLIA